MDLIIERRVRAWRSRAQKITGRQTRDKGITNHKGKMNTDVNIYVPRFVWLQHSPSQHNWFSPGSFLAHFLSDFRQPEKPYAGAIPPHSQQDLDNASWLCHGSIFIRTEYTVFVSAPARDASRIRIIACRWTLNGIDGDRGWFYASTERCLSSGCSWEHS